MENSNNIIIFCGLPGSLKTYISYRLSKFTGYAYIPTSAFGIIAESKDNLDLHEKRNQRYLKLIKLTEFISTLGVNLILDGGYYTKELRTSTLKHFNRRDSIVIYCKCDNVITRTNRLKLRSFDSFDCENSSAKSIITKKYDDFLDVAFDNPVEDYNNKDIETLITIDTDKFDVTSLESSYSKDITQIISYLKIILEEYKMSPLPPSYTTSLTYHFDSLADDYDESTVWRKSPELLESISLKLKKKSKILDIGTGTGIASKFYKKNGHFIVGIDTSASMLSKASENLTFSILADAHKLPLLDKSFDLVLMRQCIHYLDPIIALNEARRVLIKNGKVCISAIVSPSFEAKLLWQEFKNATQPLRIAVYTKSELIDFLGKTGFIVEKEIDQMIIRSENIQSIQKRAETPDINWISFFNNFKILANSIIPDISFEFDGSNISYNQTWVTIVAKIV